MGFWQKFRAMFAKKPKENPIPPLKTGIVFSGGGARGFAYVGVIRAFEEAGIDFDLVAGTSIGSLVGAIYASGISSAEMEKYALDIKQRDIQSSKLVFVPSKTERLESLISGILGDRSFSDLKKPFCAVAVDMKTGKEVRLTEGDLVKAIAGSCAVPGVYVPVEFGDMRLADGMLTNNIPADVLREMGADIVISLDINPTRGMGTDSIKTLDVLKASLRILMVANAINGYVHSDYIIKIDLSEFSQLKVRDVEQLIERGYQATKEQLSEILNALGRKHADQSIQKISRKIKAIQKKNKQIERLSEKLSEEEREKLKYIER